MDITLIIQILLNGLVIGTTYVLIALGLAVVFSIGGVFNFTHGEFCMLGGFFQYYLYQKCGLYFLLALLLSAISVAIIAILIEKLLIHRIYRHLHAVLITLLGATLILSGGAMVIFGEQDKTIQSPVGGVTSFLGIYVSYEKLFIVGIAVVFALGLYIFLSCFRMGHALRAVGQDMEAAAIVGIDTARYSTLSFAIAGFLGGTAGALLGVLFIVNPFSGIFSLLKAVIVIILGGLGTIIGAVVGGLVLGVLESFSLTYIGKGAELVTFLILIFILIFRPKGIIGHE